METCMCENTRRNVDRRDKRVACVGGTWISWSPRYCHICMLFLQTLLWGWKEQKRGWRLWEMMSGRAMVWLELYSDLDEKVNGWWVHQRCCLVTQSGTEWRGRRSQLLSPSSTKGTSEASMWWPIRKTLERCWDLLKSWRPLFSASPKVILERLLCHTSW